MLVETKTNPNKERALKRFYISRDRYLSSLLELEAPDRRIIVLSDSYGNMQQVYSIYDISEGDIVEYIYDNKKLDYFWLRGWARKAGISLEDILK